MKKNVFIALLFGAAMFLASSCGNQSTNTEEASAIDPLKYVGMYEGTLPCAECTGVETHLTLKDDSTAVLTRLYQDSDGTSESITGKWSFTDSVFSLALNGEDTLRYKIMSDTTLSQILPDSLSKKIEDLKLANILTKKIPMTVANFVGMYLQGSDKGGAYSQQLIITKEDDDHVGISIKQASGRGKGCKFTATKGILINDQIEVKLSDVDPQLKGTMVIRPLNGKDGMDVFTSKFDDRMDLMFFCGGGGSLAGEYIRQSVK